MIAVILTMAKLCWLCIAALLDKAASDDAATCDSQTSELLSTPVAAANHSLTITLTDNKGEYIISYQKESVPVSIASVERVATK